MKKMYPVVHFEMPAEDRQRMRDFYEKAFGWQTSQLGEEMGGYVTVMTTETGADMRPTTPGAINGGFFQKTKPTQYPSVVIAVDDVYQVMKEVEAAGGTILGGMTPGKPDDLPGVGLYCSIVDTEGNRVGLLQPKR